MKIVGLEIEAFQRIKVFSLKPKGNVIKITGANASGKSSALDAISLALMGARGGPEVPVRRGSGRGKVRVDLGDFIVTRMWSEGGNPVGEMWIEAKDGMQYPSPQKVLDNIMGKISFDPLAFSRMESKQQMAELKRLLGLDKVLEEMKAKELVDYQTRRQRNAYLVDLEAQRKALQYPDGLPAKKRDVDAMTQDLAEVASFNMGIEREKMRRDEMMRDLNAQRAAITAKKERITEMEKELRQLEDELTDDRAEEKKASEAITKLPKLAEPKDAQKISEDISAARAINTAIDRKIEAEAKDAEIALVTKEVQRLSRAIEDSRSKQGEVIEKAPYPVPGLGFAEEEVLYMGLPFAQASSAEQIKVSVAMGMAMNPKLRVMRIKDGSLLDDESLGVVEQMAAKEDFQVWLELVDQTGKVGVYLVDGEIAAIDGHQPESLKLTEPLGPPRKPAPRRKKDSMTPA